MPFAVRFHTCNLDTTPEERRDPMTGATLPFAVERGLTDAERRAVHARLTAGGVGPDSFGKFRVFFPGGRWGEADFPGLLGGRCVGGLLVGGEPTPEFVRLAWELATAGGCVLLPDGITRPLIPSEPLRQKVIRRWPNAVVVPSVAQLWQLLAPPPPPEEEAKAEEAKTEESTEPAETPTPNEENSAPAG